MLIFIKNVGSWTNVIHVSWSGLCMDALNYNIKNAFAFTLADHLNS